MKAAGADTTKIVAPSRDLGDRIAEAFVRATGSAPSNYIGGGTGLDVRGDLGGLDLSTVPKVFIECGNMRDAKDARCLTSGSWRQKAAQGIADGIVGFLHGESRDSRHHGPLGAAIDSSRTMGSRPATPPRHAPGGSAVHETDEGLLREHPLPHSRRRRGDRSSGGAVHRLVPRLLLKVDSAAVATARTP